MNRMQLSCEGEMKDGVSKYNFVSAGAYKQNDRNTSSYKFMKKIFCIQEEEKVKLGHELHDSVGPFLTVAKLYIDLMTAATKKEKQVKKEAISSILIAIQNIRQISGELAISQKQDFELQEQIKNLRTRIHGLEIFKISLTIRGKKALKEVDCPRKLALFRIIQEQLNNIIKYSKARLVTINISCTDKSIKLTIKDDGAGFDTSKPSKGIGLLNMEKRTKEFNGTLQIKSNPGKGCLLEVYFPVL